MIAALLRDFVVVLAVLAALGVMGAMLFGRSSIRRLG
jgi:hypothetical protein